MGIKVKFLLFIIIAFLTTSCQGGGAEFRRVLRSATRETAKSSNTDSHKEEKKISGIGIKSCPEGAKLLGSLGTTQWCSLPTKDGKGSKHGEFRKWHESGNLKVLALFENGKAQGKHTEWHSNGQKKIQGFYLNDEKNARWIEWNSEGIKLSEKSFKNGLPHGKFAIWSKKGTLALEGAYIEGLKSGTWIAYNANGGLKSKTTYKAGKKHGPQEIYSRKGEIKEIESYYADIPHGLWVTFWPDGSKKLEGNYLKGQKAGSWISYSKNGTPKDNIFFKDGSSTRLNLAEKTKQKRKRFRHSKFGKGDILGAEPPIATYKEQTIQPKVQIERPGKLSTGQNWHSF